MPESTTSIQTSHSFSLQHLGGVGLEGVEVLTGLGLSGRQARVYLALLRTGDARVQTVASWAGVHRQEMYRLLDELSALGLVERHLTAPFTFRATPIEQGIKLLLHQKTAQWNNICLQAKQLSEKFSQCSPPDAAEMRPCFGTVHESDRGKKYRQAIQNSKSKIQSVTNWSHLKQLNLHFEDALQQALKQGVRVYVVAEKPKNQRLPKWLKKASANQTNFQLKTQLYAPAAAITIFDETTTAVAFNPNLSLTKTPNLWTSNPALIALSQAYFNACWTQT